MGACRLLLERAGRHADLLSKYDVVRNGAPVQSYETRLGKDAGFGSTRAFSGIGCHPAKNASRPFHLSTCRGRLGCSARTKNPYVGSMKRSGSKAWFTQFAKRAARASGHAFAFLTATA